MVTDVLFFFFFQAEDGIRDTSVTGVQTCALPISARAEAFDFRFELKANGSVLAATLSSRRPTRGPCSAGPHSVPPPTGGGVCSGSPDRYSRSRILLHSRERGAEARAPGSSSACPM